MRILITGITGRIGGNLAAQLLGQGHEVRGLVWPKDPRIEKFKGYELELVEGSLTNYDDVIRVADPFKTRTISTSMYAALSIC
jgi:nucleoside-diphosphate-sugar epimerase